MTKDDIGTLISTMRNAIEVIDDELGLLGDSIDRIVQATEPLSTGLDLGNERYTELEDLCKAGELLAAAFSLLDNHSATSELEDLEADLIEQLEDEEEDETEDEEDEEQGDAPKTRF